MWQYMLLILKQIKMVANMQPNSMLIGLWTFSYISLIGTVLGLGNTNTIS